MGSYLRVEWSFFRPPWASLSRGLALLSVALSLKTLDGNVSYHTCHGGSLVPGGFGSTKLHRMVYATWVGYGSCIIAERSLIPCISIFADIQHRTCSTTWAWLLAIVSSISL